MMANAVWDTGAGISLVNKAFFDAHPDLFHVAGISIGTDATGTQAATLA